MRYQGRGVAQYTFVQFDETPPVLTRAPQFPEHTDEILREMGATEEQIINLKVDGACT
jgi:hypothetical protein